MLGASQASRSPPPPPEDSPKRGVPLPQRSEPNTRRPPPPPPLLPGAVEDALTLHTTACVPSDGRGNEPIQIHGKRTNPSHPPVHAAVLDCILQPAEALIRLKSLFDSKANPSTLDADGKTALHLAAATGNSDVVLVLLEAGADPNAIVPSDGSVPLHMAAMKDYGIVAALLIKWKAIQESRDSCGATALHFAVKNGADDVVSVLMRTRTNPDIVDMQDRTPLHFAVLQDRLNYVEVLLKARANPRIEDKGGETALNIAFRRHHEHAVLAILSPTNGPDYESPLALNATLSQETWNRDMKDSNEKEFAVCLLRDLPVSSP